MKDKFKTGGVGVGGLLLGLLVAFLGLEVGCAPAIQYPAEVCKVTPDEDGVPGWDCNCGEKGVEFRYRPVKDAEGVVQAWETRRNCGGYKLPGVMRSNAFPAWEGPPPGGGGPEDNAPDEDPDPGDAPDAGASPPEDPGDAGEEDGGAS